MTATQEASTKRTQARRFGQGGPIVLAIVLLATLGAMSGCQSVVRTGTMCRVRFMSRPTGCMK